MSVQIRLLSSADIRALSPATFQLAPIFDRIDAYASDHGGIFVGEVDGALAACAAVVRQNTTLTVDHFAVSPHFRGHGLGGKLMRAVIDHARTLGVTTLRAHAPGWCPEWRAFFTRLGFTYTDDTTAHSMTDMTPVELQLAAH